MLKNHVFGVAGKVNYIGFSLTCKISSREHSSIVKQTNFKQSIVLILGMFK